ncbi:MAG: alpha-isopropylmalate synthase regulatory domain-containing protein [Hominilimicola sp.]
MEINDHNHHKTYWGAGVDANINTASIYALISAVNRMLADN